MTGGARIAGYAVAALFLMGSAALFAAGSGGGFGPGIIGLLIVAGIALEPRYRSSSRALSGNWQPTGERFIDDETGEPVEVWYDPVSGSRDYRSARR